MVVYRFFDNDEVEWAAILEPNWRQTAQRMASQSVGLCLQDATELDLNGLGGCLWVYSTRGCGRVSPGTHRLSAAALEESPCWIEGTSESRNWHRVCRTCDWSTSQIARQTCSR
ncbi:hypothetical protein OKW46_002798 [Paraburkholderia sp. WSM4179]|nr:hypothetical protein [Paraburkholderia sp. WSM4179]